MAADKIATLMHLLKQRVLIFNTIDYLKNEKLSASSTNKEIMDTMISKRNGKLNILPSCCDRLQPVSKTNAVECSAAVCIFTCIVSSAVDFTTKFIF